VGKSSKVSYESIASLEMNRPAMAGTAANAIAFPAEDRFFFGPVERPLFGVFHAARQDARQDRSGAASNSPLVAVLCPPFGTEAMSLHRTYRRLAGRLASASVAALRFDLDGTGNAAGSLDDPGRLRGWVDSVRAAVAEARARVGGSRARVVLFGARFGASLAALAALEDGAVAGLALWAPTISGQGLVRELRAFRLLAPRDKPRRADGAQDVGGYLVTAATLGDIATIDLIEAARARALPPRVLVVPGDSVGEAERLAREWSGAGPMVTVGAQVRYASLIDYPHETEVPDALLATVDAWARTFSDADLLVTKTAHPSAGSTGRASAIVPRHAADARAAREAIVTFGDGGRLFGIVTRPLDEAPPGRPVLCFLNVGVNHHVGPHRFTVTLARALSAAGYASLRFDAGGLGESDAERPELENRVYARSYHDDVRAALTALETSGSADRFVLIGLCSGAHPAFQAARTDARVAGLVLLNSHTFDWQEGDPVKAKPSRRFYAEILLDPRLWREALARGVRLARFRRVLGELMRSELRLLSRDFSPRERAKMADVRAGFARLCQRGVESFLVFSSNDGSLDMMSQTLGRAGSKLAIRSHVEFEILDRFDHAFRPVEEQAEILRLIEGYLQRHFP
jgi:dienelactone hydrolase